MIPPKHSCLRLLLLLCVTLLAMGCASVEPLSDRDRRPHEPPAAAGELAAQMPLSGPSGFRILYGGPEAYQWRVASARAAHERLNIQYYIWQDDVAGRLLIAELLQVADTGVRISLLLDDMDVRGSDRALAILDQHPHIEVRVFNPFRSRWGILRTGVELVLRGSDLNHRMHNKAWIADGHLAIIGGRNIGDEYFSAGSAFNFSDIDLVIVGPLAHGADISFTDYWNSPLAIPISQLRRVRDDVNWLSSHRDAMDEWFTSYLDHPLMSMVYGQPPFVSREMLLCPSSYQWTDQAILAVDDPAKALNQEDLEPGVLEALAERFAMVEEELLLISPYFIPGAEGTRMLADMAARGIRVAVLTNSLATNDVAIAHSGYARRRQALLEAGVELYELRPSAHAAAENHNSFGLGSSRASLHTKALVVDRREVFLGSFNLDPRSAHINTELGAFVRDEQLAESLTEFFHHSVHPLFAYQLYLDERGSVRWIDHEGQIHTREPKAGFWRRFLAGFARLLPIESQL